MIRSIRFYVTEQCNAKCNNCFNRNIRTKNIMSIDMFLTLCEYFSKIGVKSVKIMGGEPTTHPNFTKLMTIAQEHFERVGLFTNGINDKIMEYTPRQTDTITYNFKFSKKIHLEKLLPDYPGARLLEVQIQATTDVDRLKNEIYRVASMYPNVIVTLTLDCTANIFSEKELIMPIYNNVLNFLSENHIHTKKDHKVPVCFSYGTKFPITEKGAICDINCAGLIDAEGNLKYCNQHSETLTNMFNEDGSVLQPEIMMNYLSMKFKNIQYTSLSKICKDCVFYDKYCNGGCFISKDIISKSDIYQNTLLPIV